jgi:hypothetical protein
MALDAKSTLLNALEQIEEVEQDLEAEVRQVAVVYSVHRTNEDGQVVHQGGWTHSSDPAWLIVALLRHMADELQEADAADEDEDE